MDYPIRLVIFIIGCVLVFGAVLFWISYSPIKRRLWKAKPADMFYKKIYKVVRNADFFLVNNLVFKSGDEVVCTVPHVIGGDKFLYLISEYYCDGCLEARGEDRSWICYFRDGTKSNISNLIYANQKMVGDFSLRLGFSQNMIK